MTSLLAQCAFAAVAAAAVNVSVSLAQDPRPGIGSQIEALGLDRAEVRAKLEGLSRGDRVAYLQGLGVRLPENAARLRPVRQGSVSNTVRDAATIDSGTGFTPAQ